MAEEILVELNFTGLTPEKYDELNQKLDAAGNAVPDGLVLHVATSREDGLFVTDVWESAEYFKTFGEESIKPLLEELGIEAPEPKIYPVYRLLKGKQLVEVR